MKIATPTPKFLDESYTSDYKKVLKILSTLLVLISESIYMFYPC